MKTIESEADALNVQGIKWIKNRYGKNLQIIRQGQKNFMEEIER